MGDADAGHEPHGIPHAAHGLVIDQFAGYDRDGLGDINEGCVGLGGGKTLTRLIAGCRALASIDLHFIQDHRVGIPVVNQFIVVGSESQARSERRGD